ncbi:MAG: hypothetical protein ACD_9C00268G0002 [uncultured bacterium]|nr:MAG: hypothetical protein ACD_9C00268G0002 [uncultured bacterium]
MEILRVKVDNLSKKEILEKIEFFLNEKGFHQIVTVNPEFILQASKNEKFREILNSSALSVADGIGLKYAFARFGKWLKCRIAGIDLMHEILKIANDKKLGVYLAVNKDGLSAFDEIKLSLKKRYPELEIDGAMFDPLGAYEIQNTRYKILLCNFGAPYQEVFINSVKNDSIRIAMGVGGSFDFITGKVKRAPKIMRILGLEWFWRLALQSWNDKEFLRKRWKRIFDAIIVFPIKIILAKNENE